jgi:dihydropteroate synthase
MEVPAGLQVGGRTLEWGARTYLMGILNITPDSFSGDGLLSQGSESLWVEAALGQARRFVAAGAEILDVGGESTRPGSQPVGVEEEARRVLPVIRALAAEVDAILSIDTYRAEVANLALQAGAHLVNDVWALRADPEMAGVIARHAAPVVMMHNRSSWAHTEIRERLGSAYAGPHYENLLQEVCQDLMESVEIAREAGIPAGHIILDPGLGFGKSIDQNMELIDRLGEIRRLGFPVLLGPSRKSFIGYTLDLPPEQRVGGTGAAVVVGIVRGADIVRIHDVEEIAPMARLADAIVRRP